jgi:hypothetical protein
MDMRRLGAASLVAALLVVPSAAGRAVAATPSPTGTATSTETPVAIPTLAPADRPMTVIGHAWVDGYPGGGDVSAFIGGVECGSGPQLATDAGESFALEVPAAAEKAGCGTPGAVVTFKIGTRDARPTAAWEAGAYLTTTLIAGPPFSLIAGTFTPPAGAGYVEVEPLVGGVVCGQQLNPLLGEGPSFDFIVTVEPAERRAGCGTPGAIVTFRFVRVDGMTRTPLGVAPLVAVWTVWDGSPSSGATARALPSTGVGEAARAANGLVAEAMLAAVGGLGCLLAGWVAWRGSGVG